MTDILILLQMFLKAFSHSVYLAHFCDIFIVARYLSDSLWVDWCLDNVKYFMLFSVFAFKILNCFFNFPSLFNLSLFSNSAEDQLIGLAIFF